MRAEILRFLLCTDFQPQVTFRHPSSDPACAGPPIELRNDCHWQSLKFVTLRFATAPGGRLTGLLLNYNLSHQSASLAHTIAGVRNVKEEEKKPVPWEAVDPKPPVIQSGHLENRRQN